MGVLISRRYPALLDKHIEFCHVKKISDRDCGKLPLELSEYCYGTHKKHCGKAKTGIADCTENGDEGAGCVFGNHCACSYPRFVCDEDRLYPNNVTVGYVECSAGVSCITSESSSQVEKMLKLQGPSPKRNPSFKAKPAPKAKSGALLLRSGPSS